MRGLWKSAALAASFSRAVLAEAVPSYELVERQSTNGTTANVSAATWIYQGRGGFDDDDDDGFRGPPAGVDRDGDGQGPPSWVTNGRGRGGGDGGPGNFTFTITVNPQNNDMWFRMAAPAMYSWIGIGVGSSMSNAKTYFIAYEGSASNSITLAARGQCDECEPGYTDSVRVEKANSTLSDTASYGIRDDMYYVTGFVKNGTRRVGIDPNKKDQSFIFAVGRSNSRPNTDDPAAALRIHGLHGGFQLDMTQAHGTALPAFATAQRAVTRQGGSSRDNDRSSTGHAIMMCFGFVVMLPVGILLLKIVSVKAHMIAQGIGLVIITVGWIVGFVISRKYQRSMNFDSTHQIIGIVVYLLLLAQFTTGFLHHRIYLKTQQPTWFIKPHKFGLGGVVLALGIVNCSLGFRFAQQGYYNMIFVPIVIGMILICIAAIMFKRMRAKRKARNAMGPGVFGGPAPPYRAPSGSQVPQQEPSAHGYYANPSGASSTVGGSWQRNDVELGKMGPPPSYSQEPQKPREML